jgi:hypothetical protein
MVKCLTPNLVHQGLTRTSFLLPLFLFVFLCVSAPLRFDSHPPSEDNYIGSSACAACHSSLYGTYSATPMAHSSGKAGSGPFAEQFEVSSFTHARSGVRYRVFKEQDSYCFEFVREPTKASSQEIRGQRRMDYFIGSGAVGRSYAFSLDGFLFQAPVAYYSGPERWNLSPGYDQYDRVYLSRPIAADCLQCHASRVQPINGTPNRYGEIPFLEGGIGCERCHGPGRTHVEKMGSGEAEGSREIVNPAKLDPSRRDSVCAQCHLTGEVRVAKPGRSLSMYRPGDLLSDYAVFFVWAESKASGLRVTSHFEDLGRSGCKKASGDRFWCGSCHNPHRVIANAQRLEYFRQKCLACHKTSDCQSNLELRAKNKDDCIRCHMPKNPRPNVEHAVFTDHSIPRLLYREPRREARTGRTTLVPFWGGTAETRDLGLAYAKLAATERNEAYYARAFELLKQVEAETQDDSQVMLQLGYLYDHAGEEDKAMIFYQRARSADPSQVEASVNLGTVLASRGRLREAMSLWEDVLKRDPALETARINLAVAYFRIGNQAAAKAVLRQALKYEPDSQAVWKLLAEHSKE